MPELSKATDASCLRLIGPTPDVHAHSFGKSWLVRRIPLRVQVRALPGVGFKAERSLHNMGVNTVAQLRQVGLRSLQWPRTPLSEQMFSLRSTFSSTLY